MIRILLLMVLVLGPLFAEDQKPVAATANQHDETRLVYLQHADPKQVRDLLVQTGASVSWDNVLRVLVISGTPDELASLQGTIRQLDEASAKMAQSDVQLIVYVLGASNASQTVPPLTKALQATIEQLKPMFPYQTYQLLETAVVRGQAGQESKVFGAFQPILTSAEGMSGRPTDYSLTVSFAGINPSGRSYLVHIDRFNFDSRIGYMEKFGANTQYQSHPVIIQTRFDIATGQKVVVGQAGAGGNNAIFLVVEAKVAE